MKKELKDHIKEENKYIDLLNESPKYIPSHYNMDKKKVTVGIIQGNPKEYNPIRDILKYKYFNTWKEAYFELYKSL